VSDLHVIHPRNREVVAALAPGHPGDWLIVAGDVGEKIEDIEWALTVLAERFEKVIWTPGNHELWSTPSDPVKIAGVARYLHLVEICRRLGVVTPEDPFPVWHGAGGPVVVAPLFLLYDYTFRPEGARTKEEGLRAAHEAGVVCSDEYLLDPAPYPSRDAWCRARVELTEKRLMELPEDLPTVLVSHFPLVRDPTFVLRYPVFAQWCGTEATADWHRRFRAAVAVYGHLHIPRTIAVDGVRFEEVSLGYPREWTGRTWGGEFPRVVLPAP
jgi:3',5'-cyclic AMP phosphodiesterase CpdA